MNTDIVTEGIVLTQEMIHLITTHTIGCVATVRPDGLPAVSPKATFLVLDDWTIAFAHIRSPGTVENLRRCPDLEVNFIDIFARRGCRIRGHARYVPRDDADADLRKRFKDEWADLYPLIKGIVVIAVTQAEVLSSPSYDIGATTSQLIKDWLRRYATALGFTVTKQGDEAAESDGTMHSSTDSNTSAFE